MVARSVLLLSEMSDGHCGDGGVVQIGSAGALPPPSE
jgi:hypothetical protein